MGRPRHCSRRACGHRAWRCHQSRWWIPPRCTRSRGGLLRIFGHRAGDPRSLARRKLAPSDAVVYIDTDAHQGNGVARCFKDNPRVLMFDMFNGSIYPRDSEA
ncbi:MAG: hypothetical protein GC162_13025 [Planctomycetes bacterium]|nr:hypothetical protein [Planctomycetota bacterium]